ncbi:MAG: ArgE/DapE family deacylase [Lactobacillus sp.]|jgi:succinyl-diaminopimelate desuccinylase|nr:ArgE/DapE family deacylase [Lactobacillus sp.]
MSEENRIELLRKILKIASVNDKESQVANVIQDFLGDQPNVTFKRVQYAPGRENLIIDVNAPTTQKRVLGFNGHLDVVDPGDTDLWTYPPFAAKTTKSRIYGRGTSDMKGGVAAMVSALKELLADNFQFKGGLRLLLTVGEEIDNFGARQLADLGYANPLTALIVGEPTNHTMWYAHKGIIDFTATAHGKSAHGAMPQLGINAIDHLFDFYAAAKKAMAPILKKADPALGHTTFNVTLINGGNQINSIPQAARLRGNIRTVTAVSNQAIQAALQQAAATTNALPKHKIDLSIDSSIDAIASDAHSEIIEIAQAAATANDWPAVVTTGAPTTDASLFKAKCPDLPFVILGPGNNTAHQVDEYVTLADFNKITAIYKNIIQQYLG